MLNRRTLLAVVGASFVAGCSGDSDSGKAEKESVNGFEISIEDNDRTIGVNEAIETRVLIRNTSESSDTQDITSEVNGEPFGTLEIELEPDETEETFINLRPLSESEVLTQGENTVKLTSEDDEASITYTVEESSGGSSNNTENNGCTQEKLDQPGDTIRWDAYANGTSEIESVDITVRNLRDFPVSAELSILFGSDSGEYNPTIETEFVELEPRGSQQVTITRTGPNATRYEISATLSCP